MSKAIIAGDAVTGIYDFMEEPSFNNCLKGCRNMEGDRRREEILKILKNSSRAVSGSGLAKMLGVSRQVIVQDIALLRAVNKNILATSKGYLLYQQHKENHHRCFSVRHSSEAIRDELMTVIDNGGQVLDIVVEHDVYGQICVDLNLENRADVEEFCRKIEKSRAKPLNILADDDHVHTVAASSEVILDNIERALRDKGYLK